MDSKQLEELRKGRCGEAYVVFATRQGWKADIEHLVPANLTWWCFANAWLVADAAGYDRAMREVAAEAKVAAQEDRAANDDLLCIELVDKLAAYREVNDGKSDG